LEVNRQVTGVPHPHGIHVGPEAHPDIVAAVSRAGGEVVAVGDARAIVWLGGDPAPLGPLLLPDIEWVQLPGAGVDSFFAKGVITHDRTYTCAGPAYANNVAEHALALMLACGRNLHTAFRAKSWRQYDIVPLRGATVFIIGCGRIGRALIALLDPFQVTVFASTRSGEAVPGASRTVAAGEEVQLLGSADYVVLAAPATPASRHLIGPEQLAAMAPHAYLVNIARGVLVDTEALLVALRTGSIAGAALDVVDPEPLPTGHPLWGDPHVMITPHIANTMGRMIIEITPLVEENVRRFLRGDPLLGLIRADLGY